VGLGMPVAGRSGTGLAGEAGWPKGSPAPLQTGSLQHPTASTHRPGSNTEIHTYIYHLH